MKYEPSYKAALLAVPVAQILLRLGCRTDHSRDNFYYSPFHQERTPSFHVLPKANVWTDFGDGTKGGVLDLVCRLRNVSKAEAFDWLSENFGSSLGRLPEVVGREVGTSSRPSREGSRVTIFGCDAVTDRRVIGYAASRGIPVEVASRYCWQLRYGIRGVGGVRYALAFPNLAGGWVYRSERFKGCSKSGVTFVDCNGRFSTAPSCDRVVLFEGFINFLSYLVLKGRLVPGADVCVLNSVTNLRLAGEFLRAHAVVDSCTDLDRAGDKCLSDLVAACPSSVVNDRREVYGGRNDLNDLLMDNLKR